MQLVGSALRLSATDLVGHLNCKALTQMDRAVAFGERKRPYVADPMLEVLRERGARHEAAYVAHLAAQGQEMTVIPGAGVDDAAVEATIAAMRAGASVIVQAALRDGVWIGRADVLHRVETPSGLGPWSYEPLDTKLARETKAGTVLQLCLYAELLQAMQGAAPQFAYVVAPWSDFTRQAYRVADYAAYFRRVRAGFDAALAADQAAPYPEPVPHCDVCAWRLECDARRRADDHLSLIAGIAKTQMAELRDRGVATLAALAQEPLPLSWRPERGSVEALVRVREQARIQLAGRIDGAPRHERLAVQVGQGLSRLPEPSAGDLFLDLEGDPFVGEAGLEYLFGYSWADEAGVERYTADWSLTRADERSAFERFVDFASERRARWPDMHIYHYAPYEPAALKRLMGRYGTRSEELDDLLRGEAFVDLYAVVRQGLRASVESYSIKRLEPFYGFERGVPLVEANRALADLQAGLELGDPDLVSEQARAVVEGYNRDDCRSTLRLRDWLEHERRQAIASGTEVSRPAPAQPTPPEDLAAWLARIEPVRAQLLEGVPDDPNARSAEQQGRWLLANFLDWHRQENKATWWEYFRLRDLDEEELLDERVALAGLTFDGAVGEPAKIPTHRYRFPPQETQLRGDEPLKSAGDGEAYGTVVAVSLGERWIDIKKTQKTADLHATAVFTHRSYPIGELQESLFRLAVHVAAHGIEGPGPYQAARDLLLRCAPPLPADLLAPDAIDIQALAVALGPGVLPVQGPPGSGKTFNGARMICHLVAEGRTVGVTANSHKVIRHLLDKVREAAADLGVEVRCLQKPDDKQDDVPGLAFVYTNAAVFRALSDSCDVAGGTPWLWAREEAFESLDVLVVDEAGQMSLANVLAVASAARSVVLLGDPQQLDQPLQGAHPEGTDVSALRHVLGSADTITPAQGLFLAETWRLHPELCRFTSELFYGGRLHSKPGLEHQALRGAGSLSGSGLRFLSYAHRGNQNAAPEEADAIASLLAGLVGRATWVDSEEVERPLEWKDVLVIAPYNAQVFELQARLPQAVIGTVDKFQGQQAPLVVYSMTTSSQADAPRGFDFLYSLNRLNVATSRPKCVCLLVASPELLAADCRTPSQMQLVNALCRYVELAIPVRGQ